MALSDSDKSQSVKLPITSSKRVDYLGRCGLFFYVLFGVIGGETSGEKKKGYQLRAVDTRLITPYRVLPRAAQKPISTSPF